MCLTSQEVQVLLIFNRNKGIGLLEALLTVALTISATTFVVNKWMEIKETERAQEAGKQLSDFNKALNDVLNSSQTNFDKIKTHCAAGCLVRMGLDTSTTSNNRINFIFNNSSTDEAYPSELPSSFPMVNSYGGTYSAEVKVTGVPGEEKVISITSLNLDDSKKKFAGEIIKYAGARAGSLAQTAAGATMTANKAGFSFNASNYASVTSNGTLSEIGALAMSVGIKEADIAEAAASGSLRYSPEGAMQIYTYTVQSDARRGYEYHAPTGTSDPPTGSVPPSSVSCSPGYVWKAGRGCVVPCYGIFLQ